MRFVNGHCSLVDKLFFIYLSITIHYYYWKSRISDFSNFVPLTNATKKNVDLFSLLDSKKKYESHWVFFFAQHFYCHRYLSRRVSQFYVDNYSSGKFERKIT